MTTLLEERSVDFNAVKARQKATWESGNFGQVANHLVPTAEEFMSRLPLRPGLQLLDAACGTGNLAVIAARAGCRVTGIDIAANLIEQARRREGAQGIDYREGDAEALPFPDASFDMVASMFGVMFTPRPRKVSEELLRVTRPGGMVAMANWTQQGLIGQMLKILGLYSPPQNGIPSPLLWGDEAVVRDRLEGKATGLRLHRRIARMHFPFSPAATVEFFRNYYGPTRQVFASLAPDESAALQADLENFHVRNNAASRAGETELRAEYLEVHAIRL